MPIAGLVATTLSNKHNVLLGFEINQLYDDAMIDLNKSKNLSHHNSSSQQYDDDDDDPTDCFVCPIFINVTLCVYAPYLWALHFSGAEFNIFSRGRPRSRELYRF